MNSGPNPSLGNRKSQHSFAQIPNVNMARSKFDRSFATKDTMYFDELTPIFVDLMYPGDTANVNVKSFCRLAPQVVPLMDNMYINYYFFAVPLRLVWDNFEKFMGQQDNPNSSTDYLIPQVNVPVTTGFQVGSMADHFGIPTDVPSPNAPADPLTVNALPFRAVNLIWNEWFRDQNLQNSVTVQKGDGPDAATLYPMLKVNKAHDYFTSCLPWPQKGDAVLLPLGQSAPVIGNGTAIGFDDGTSEFVTFWPSATSTRATSQNVGDPTGTIATVVEAPVADAIIGLSTDPDHSGMFADLSEATAATVNQFREAILMQSLLELNARGGTRYVELIRAHFNVVSPDFRLQRPEFLSMAKTYIDQHPVAQTSETTETGTPQGNLAAFSTSSNLGNKVGFTKSFVEHTLVIGFAKACADITYQQGLNRFWSERTKYGMFWPKLQELGEQAVLRQEIYWTSNATNNAIVFGYQERYSELRYMPSLIKGQFRSTYAESLDVWHLAEEFETAPELNNAFIQSNTPIERSLVLPDEAYPHLLCDFWFDYKHARPMVTHGVPATLGRF